MCRRRFDGKITRAWSNGTSMFKKAGQGLHVFESRLGLVGLAWTPRGVCRLEIGRRSREATLAALQCHCPDFTVARPVPAAVKETARRLKAQLVAQLWCLPLTGEPRRLELPA